MLVALKPDLWGMAAPYTRFAAYLHQVGWLWLGIGAGGLLFRTVHLFFIADVRTGLVWASKIVTDPLHDIWLYHAAPAALLRGELIDPMGPIAAHIAANAPGRALMRLPSAQAQSLRVFRARPSGALERRPV